jgi:hypothetical protein
MRTDGQCDEINIRISQLLCERACHHLTSQEMSLHVLTFYFSLQQEPANGHNARPHEFIPYSRTLTSLKSILMFTAIYVKVSPSSMFIQRCFILFSSYLYMVHPPSRDLVTLIMKSLAPCRTSVAQKDNIDPCHSRKHSHS